MRLILPTLLLVPVAAAAVPYEQYILAPSSRTVRPASVHLRHGPVSSEDALLNGQVSPGQGLTLDAFNSSVTYDFGKNIAGWINFNTTSSAGSVGFTFAESSMWVSSETSDATLGTGQLDGPLVFNITGAGHYSPSLERQRGGFRYLTVVNLGSDPVSINDLWVHFTAMPHWEDDALRSYTGWFHSNDEKLNRYVVCAVLRFSLLTDSAGYGTLVSRLSLQFTTSPSHDYPGAYTNQLVTIDPTRGCAIAVIPANLTFEIATNGLALTSDPDGLTLASTSDNSTPTINSDWVLNTTIAHGTSVLVDGGKRDRLVWSGDMSISLPTVAVSTYDLVSSRNALSSVFSLQYASGALPYAGFPSNVANLTSFTYHLYALIGIGNIYQWSGDEAYVAEHWTRWKTGMEWAIAQIDNTGLANVSANDARDWARVGMGGHNIAANSLLFHTLNVGAALARTQKDATTAKRWVALAKGIQAAAISLLWQPGVGLFKDNETTTLAPQDGNAWAVKSGLVTNASQIAQISEALQARWGKYGAPAPEAVDIVSPFISGFELEAHFVANRTSAGLALIRDIWADFMLGDPRMTNSTLIEGYSPNGMLEYSPTPGVVNPGLSHAHGWSSGPTILLTVRRYRLSSFCH